MLTIIFWTTIIVGAIVGMFSGWKNIKSNRDNIYLALGVFAGSFICFVTGITALVRSFI